MQRHYLAASRLLQEGRLSEALTEVRLALGEAPHSAPAHCLLGRIYEALQQPSQAADAYWDAIDLDVLCIEAHFAIAKRLVQCAPQLTQPAGKSASQSSALSSALRSAGELMAQGRYVDALQVLFRAARLSPYSAEVHYDIGVVLNAMGAAEHALVHYDLAGRFRPEWFDAWDKAAIVATSLGLEDISAQYIIQAFRLRPSDALLLRRIFSLRGIEQSVQSIDERRSKFEASLDHLLAKQALDVPNPFPDAQFPLFYLAYHGKCNRDINVKVSQIMARAAPWLTWTAPQVHSRRQPHGRIKLGFVSHYLRNHSIGRTTAGLVSRLSRERFEVFVVNLYPGPPDEWSRRIQGCADHTLNLGASLKDAQLRIAELRLDVLFYQDIGLESFSYYLAHARLAPVQCVSFGHPDTTGIANMDYFISNDLYEVPAGADHYSERLFLLHDLPTLAYYYRPPAPAQRVDRHALGIDSGEHIYLCAQTLFKLHPDFDQMLGEILRRDARGRVVLVRGQCEQWCAQLRFRFARTIPDVAERIVFTPSRPSNEFLQLLSAVDVVLDTPHFNGMNSSLEAFAVGAPVVTLPMQLQRGRHTQAMYRAMNIDDCVARDAMHYVDIATGLAADPEFRRSVTDKIAERAHLLFENDAVTAEFERFFATAVSQLR